MKKIRIITIAVLLSAAVTQIAFAGGHEVYPTEKTISAMHLYFPSANNVTWHENGMYSIARFTLGQDPVTATFDAKGSLVSTFRNIPLAQLPFDIYLNLNTHYGKDQVRHILECSDHDNHFYVITLESTTQWIQLKTDGEGSFIVLEQFDKI
jgi:hypothetical protein